MHNFGFVAEHLLGHVTHYQNLKYWATQDSTIRPIWMPIEARKNDIWERLPMIRRNWSLQSSLRARDAIQVALRKQPIDALFLHTQTLALFASSFMRQIPTVISTDATPLNYDSVGAGYEHKVGGNPLLERQKFLWSRKTFHAATALVTFCQWAKDSLVNDYGVPADKVVVISSGLDLEQWQFKSKKASDEPVRLLFVGSDFARKGGYVLLEAFRNGLEENCVLDIVTKDAKVAAELSGVEHVQVHQNLIANSPQLKELFAKADIFVFPTQADCYPNAILEAMAVGLPIVATDVGAIREQVELGENGLLLPSSNASDLVKALNLLILDQSKRESMAIASRRLAEERFDGRRNYNRILSLMKSLSENHAERLSLQSSLISKL